MFEVYKTTMQLMKKKELYDKLRGVVNTRVLDANVRRALQVLDTYWQNYPGHNRVVPGTFLAELDLQHPDLSESDLQMYTGMVDIMMQEPDEDSAKGLIRSLRTLDYAQQLETAHENYQQGLDIDLYQTITDLGSRFERDISRDLGIDYVRDSIAEIIEDEESGHTLPWFLNCLSGSMPNVRTGMQVIFAARPGKGKTSFCAKQAVYLASRTPDDRPVVWFNNEGKGRRIKGTVLRAAIGRSFDEIKELGHEAALEEYCSVVGNRDHVRIFDIHGRDYRFLERIISDHRPAVVIFDMLDNVHGFSDAARTDLRLEQLYQWAREQAVIHDFLSLPTSQISVEGEDLAWCDQSMLKDSKTAKQGACDAIITMGAVSMADKVNSRFLYVPKTKMNPAKGFPQDCRSEVYFDGARCQFSEVQPESPPV